ncbi:Crp/Fnr family transcriptional regulator [Paenibacillus agaridevorans]|jgi:thiosulfate dehydrogenase [quinone] large subunit|uniref:Crp/Fnr family transcriptional regulator n=1 Tax=Paenibacillus agaridevorans TaxID=171404 RepID=A0A2R5EQI0_9BACL|nr:Crp/Fnr family transcriptional regulator [Paenibacillus agaridevorans]
MMKWLRENVYAAGIVTIVRLIVGWAWLDAGFHKLKGGFDATGYLKNAVANPVMDKATNELVYPTFTKFIEHFALPNVKLINILIPVGEFLVGVGLIVGGLTAAAAFFGLAMNFMFLFAGTVSTNPWLVLLGVIVLLAGTNAGRFGLDHYLLPIIRKGWLRVKGRGGAAGTGTGAGAGGKLNGNTL